MTEGDGESAVRNASNYWHTLAPHHWRLEDNYLTVSSVRLILGDIRQPRHGRRCRPRADCRSCGVKDSDATASI